MVNQIMINYWKRTNNIAKLREFGLFEEAKPLDNNQQEDSIDQENHNLDICNTKNKLNKTIILHFRLDKNVLSQLKALCDKEKSLSDIIRIALINYYKLNKQNGG